MESNDLGTTDANSAQQSLALRRELRRKKILESSKARLDKLNSRSTSAFQNENLDGEPSYTQYSDPEVEPDIPIRRSFLPEQPAPRRTTSRNAFLKSRVHIILAACFGFLLALYTNSSVFIPVLLFVIAELAFLQNFKEDHLPASMGPLLLMFINPNITSKIKQFSSIFFILQSLLGDLAITVCVVCSGSMLLLNFRPDYATIVK
ncbi:uncharacterized protein LOC6731780 [Drosophila simulans]|uniref:GD22276 n=1 Tax=Drosophila simulans TaxID=7240 RepID=B4Q8T5_DROSI|nr:uncharacterized protein LOC6731780 [Drosophila simulans]EDX04500.1 GD22276 [Drosophila simulans]KMY89483.1 uncharacterized protein Dsimw501_GD22276 [Drosophila simulans]